MRQSIAIAYGRDAYPEKGPTPPYFRFDPVGPRAELEAAAASHPGAGLALHVQAMVGFSRGRGGGELPT